MSGRLINLLRLGLFATLSLAPLHAQLDVRLQAMTTDSMDVYKNPTTVKPEILTLIDMSGSTAAVTWSPGYTPATGYSYDRDNWTQNLTTKNSVCLQWIRCA